MKQITWSRGRWAGVALVTALFVQQWRGTDPHTASTSEDPLKKKPDESENERPLSTPRRKLENIDARPAGTDSPISEDETIAAWFEQAESALEVGRFEDAESAWLAVLRINPKQVHALSELGFLYGSVKQDYQTALEYLRRAIVLDPENQEVAHELSVVYGKLEDVEGGIADFEDYTRQFPKSEPLHYTLASMLVQAKRMDDSIQHWQRVYELSDDKVRASRDLASAYMESRSFAKANDVYRQLEDHLLRDAAQKGHSALLRDEWAKTRMARIQALLKLSRITEAEELLVPLENEPDLKTYAEHLRSQISRAKKSG